MISPQLQAQLDLASSKPRAGKGVVQLLVEYFQTSPRLMRFAFQYFLPHLRWLRLKSSFVSTQAHVREVMARDDDFSVGPQVGPAMKCGAFVLGIDRGPQYRHDMTFLWETFYDRKIDARDEIPNSLDHKYRDLTCFGSLFADVSAIVQAAIDEAKRKDGRLDLVENILKPTCAGAVQKYLGLGPDSAEWRLALWNIFGELAKVIILPTDANLDWEKKTLRIAVQEAIAAAKAHGSRAGASTVIERMYWRLAASGAAPAQIEDDIYRNICGLGITGCHPVAKAAAQAIYIFFLREQEMEETFRKAQKAARSGGDEMFWPYIEEALRFFPPFPLVIRACPRETVLDPLSESSRTILAGQRVIVGLIGATLDPAAVPFPDSFRLDRAPSEYMTFGSGMHACFGYVFARQMLIAILKPLFANGFECVPGRRGKLVFDGVIPKSYPIILKS